MISFIERVEKVYRLFRTQVPTEDLRSIILLYHFLYKAYEQLNQREIFKDQLLKDDPNYFGEIVKSKVSEIERLFPAIFDIINDLNIREFLHYSQRESAEIFKILYQEELDQFEYYSNTFDAIIYFFNTKLKRTSQGGEEFTLSRIFKSLIGDVSSVYDPACGTGELLNVFDNGNTSIYGQDIDGSALSIAKLRFIFNSNSYCSYGDSFYADGTQNKKVDAVICHPPFNTSFDKEVLIHNAVDSYFRYGVPSKSNANMLWLQLALANLKPEGTGVVLLPNGSLTTGGREGHIRKSLVESGRVEAIISVPSSILMTSSVSCSIWVLSNRQRNHNEILMANIKETVNPPNTFLLPTYDQNLIKLAECYKQWKNSGIVTALDQFQAMSINIEDIARNDFQLLPQRYLPIKELEGVNLDEAVELRELLTPAKRIPVSKIQPDKVRKLSIKDLSSSVDNYKIDPFSLDEIPNENKLSIYQDNALLIAKVGLSLKPSYIRGFISEFIALSNVYSFKVDTERVSIDYLIQELNKDYVLHQVARYRTGNTHPSIRKSDFLKVKINLPSISEQLIRVKEEKEIRFKSLAKLHGYEDEIARLKEVQRKDLGSKKHNIMQHLNNAKSSCNILIKMMERSNGVLKNDQVINPKTGVTVEERLKRLDESIDDILFYTDNLTNDITFSESEELDAHKLVKHCVRKGLQRSNVAFIDGTDVSLFKEQKPIISVSKKDFEILYNNIIENAITHGFLNTKSEFIFRYEVIVKDDKVDIIFENNGIPFPKGMGKKEVYCTRGEKAGATGNTGEGSWQVCQIAEHYKADMTILDEPDMEFAVGFIFSFDLIR